MEVHGVDVVVLCGENNVTYATGHAAPSHEPARGGATRVVAIITKAEERLGRAPLLAPLAGEPGSVALLTTPDARKGDAALNPDGAYPDWLQAVAARSALTVSLYRPGRSAARVRCPLLVLVCDQDESALAEPAVRAGRRAPAGSVVHLPGDHYSPFQDQHEQTVRAELAFLERHVGTASS